MKITTKDGAKSVEVPDLTPSSIEKAAAQMGVTPADVELPPEAPPVTEKAVYTPEEQTEPRLKRDDTLDKHGEPVTPGDTKEAYPGLAAKVAATGAANFYRERIPEEFRKKRNPLPGAEDPSKGPAAVGDYSGLLRKPEKR